MAKLVANEELYNVLCEARYHTEMARDAWRRAAQLQRRHASREETVLLDNLSFPGPRIDPETAYRVLQALTPVEMLRSDANFYRIAISSALQAYLAGFDEPDYDTSTFVDMIVATLFDVGGAPGLIHWYRQRANDIEAAAGGILKEDA